MTHQLGEPLTWIRLAKKRLAHQHGVHTGLAQGDDIVRCVNSAFRDEDDVGGDVSGEPEGHIDTSLARPQVTIVHSE